MTSYPAPHEETSKGFVEEFFFLSNFAPSPMTVQWRKQGQTFHFATGEHLFQAMKAGAVLQTDDAEAFLRLMEQAPTPAKAKLHGRRVRIDIARWNRISATAMRRTLFTKFDQNPELHQKLKDTGTLQLVEYNDWNDRLWGKDINSREGKNQLGEMLMSYRDVCLKGNCSAQSVFETAYAR